MSEGTNGTWRGAIIGSGQRVTKHETAETESGLKVEQARIMARAGLRSFLWLVLAVLLIGPDLLLAAGFALLAWLALKVVRARWVLVTPRPKLARALYLLLIAGVGVLWYVAGFDLAVKVWPPVWWAYGWLYWRGEPAFPFPVWLRALLLVVALSQCFPWIALAVTMVIEVFDSNWPPVYEERDPGRGPWMPWHRPYTRDDPPPEPKRVVEATFRAKNRGPAYLPRPVGGPPPYGVGGGGNGHRTRIIQCPADIATLEQLREFGRLALEHGVSTTRTQMAKEHGVFTDPGWRAFQDWAERNGLLAKAGPQRNAPYTLTEDGEAWLEAILYGAREGA